MRHTLRSDSATRPLLRRSVRHLPRSSGQVRNPQIRVAARHGPRASMPWTARRLATSKSLSAAGFDLPEVGVGPLRAVAVTSMVSSGRSRYHRDELYRYALSWAACRAGHACHAIGSGRVVYAGAPERYIPDAGRPAASRIANLRCRDQPLTLRRLMAA
jgi:hypothetical protein